MNGHIEVNGNGHIGTYANGNGNGVSHHDCSHPPPGLSLWNAPTLHQSSNFRGLVKSGQKIYGIALSLPSVHVAKALAVTGADYIWIDMEHTAFSPSLLVEIIQAITFESGGKTIPIVRVPNKTSTEYITWALNAGAGGIMIPHIETAKDVAQIIGACRYAPIGHRSSAPFTFIPGVTDITPQGQTPFSLANRHIAIIPQIESVLGVENLDVIMGNENIDMVMVGGRDLRLDMGLPGQNGSEPEYRAILDKIIAASKKYSVPLMAYTANEEGLRRRVKDGFTSLLVCADFTTLAFGTMNELNKAKKVTEEASKN
ncbi:2,4-dihydroxyhept-2-ene-1,7-dioic acid aldolase [Favolaschia claudopus]|uniref:2,4-dihydroxyhept-2-ene-1,7-dioic acid aldolase n=1 Tax=Favolaschia claudopus TaxID=2862362 RepID=A0AAW0D5V8_9AGAR